MPAMGTWVDRSSHLAACHMEDAASGHSRAGRAPEPAKPSRPAPAVVGV
jgi:peptide/nickel transport system ATP-binding protein